MTTESMGQPVPITQTAPDTAAQAAQPPAQPGAGQGQGGSPQGAEAVPVLAPWFNGGTLSKPPSPTSANPNFYLNADEKAAAERLATDLLDKQARSEEAKARQEEARLERARLGSGGPRTSLAAPTDITLEFAMASDTATVKLEYLVDPFLPRGCVVCFAGRGSSAKSSFVASLSTYISSWASTLWLSVEEPSDWVKVRHMKAGGQEGTLAVVTAVASRRDRDGRVIGSNVNIYEHLEPAILQAQASGMAQPLRLVVLDTAVGLTTWAKGESPNDDGAVKRLMAYLQALAEKHDLTIAFIQHANKGKHDYFADTVAGSSAWTNSPRLSFVHGRDRQEEYGYVMRVAKLNLTQAFGMKYRTEPVHVLHERQDGGNSVLCRVVPGLIVGRG